MNLICFPHYTCGGLLCDILQDTFSQVGSHGGLKSINHSIGRIGDSDSIYDQFDPDFFYNTIKNLKVDPGNWVGTHCWPGQLDLGMFDQVLLITTETYRSKVYRWIRAYYHYYLKSQPWYQESGQRLVDKQRETAKNYLKPFKAVSGTNVVNLEFSEVVEQTMAFRRVVEPHDYAPHMTRWQGFNKFLYTSDMWSHPAVRRFHEAELETALDTHYLYE